MFKKTAIAALLSSAPFASTDSSVSARRLRAQVHVPVNPTQQRPVPRAELEAVMSQLTPPLVAPVITGAPVCEEMVREGVHQQQQQQPRKKGCCDQTCTECNNCCMYHHTDPCFNLWLFHHYHQEALRRQTALDNPASAREAEEGGCGGCGAVQCPTGECNCCCPCETAGRFIAPVLSDVRDFGNEAIVRPVTECGCPSRDFFCTLPEECPIQIPTDITCPQCPTDLPTPQCSQFPSGFCCIPDIEFAEAASQCGTGVTACLGKCGECPGNASGACEACLKCCEACPAI